MVATTPVKRVAELSRKLKIERFDLRSVRRSIETMLAGLGISRDVRAQLLSHGLTGVQQVHYDRHSYMQEKRSALEAWGKALHNDAARESAPTLSSQDPKPNSPHLSANDRSHR